ncbi:MAG TPA: response regulator [Planctomycetota bacterium]|nr:response regulator [Planctomycetota bacterium]
MPDHRVLLVGGRDRLPVELPPFLKRTSAETNQFVVDGTAQIHDALARVSQKGYDAVICWAEREDELAAISRLRKENPRLPILLLTSQESPEFQKTALEAGVTQLVRNDHELEVIAEHIRLAVRSGLLLREHRAHMERAYANSRELRTLTGKALEPAKSARSKVANASPTGFVPLLVEDNPDQAHLMLQAFQEADIFAPLPVLKTGEEAIAYLSGAAPFEHRNRFDLPSLLFLDYQLPFLSGLDVLEWIRMQPHLRRLPVAMLSSSTDEDVMYRAYQLGVHSYHSKPAGFTALVELVSSLKRVWGTPRQQHRG